MFNWKFDHKERQLKREIEQLRSFLNAANERLATIAALETPNCASIGKRMARIARGEG